MHICMYLLYGLYGLLVYRTFCEKHVYYLHYSLVYLPHCKYHLNLKISKYFFSDGTSLRFRCSCIPHLDFKKARVWKYPTLATMISWMKFLRKKVLKIGNILNQIKLVNASNRWETVLELIIFSLHFYYFKLSIG